QKRAGRLIASPGDAVPSILHPQLCCWYTDGKSLRASPNLNHILTHIEHLLSCRGSSAPYTSIKLLCSHRRVMIVLACFGPFPVWRWGVLDQHPQLAQPERRRPFLAGTWTRLSAAEHMAATSHPFRKGYRLLCYKRNGAGCWG